MVLTGVIALAIMVAVGVAIAVAVTLIVKSVSVKKTDRKNEYQPPMPPMPPMPHEQNPDPAPYGRKDESSKD